MQIVNKVLSKWNKKVTELKSHEVELAAPNLTSYLEKAQSAYNDGKTNARGVVQRAADEMLDARKQISNIVKDLDKQFEKVSKTADDLGVDIYSTKVGKNFAEVSKQLEEYSISALELQRKLEKFNI